MTADAGAQTTVVIPVWDEYVAGLPSGALASLTGQEPAPRIVVVDNASTIALPCIEPPAEVVRSSRRLTVGAARNLGLKHVTTPYVVFWDADDEMLPGTLALLESAIGSDPRMAAFGAGIVEAPSGARHRWPRRWIASLIRFPALFALVDSVWSIYPSTGATIMKIGRAHV